MSIDASKSFPLSADLQVRLNLIVQTIPSFWERKPYQHFTNHGPAHSERIRNQKLAQLAQELPEAERLINDEIYVVSAAAWLYEIGMQSQKLRPELEFEAEPGVTLLPAQLQEIRAKKHLLSYRLIADSLRGGYRGPSLGLTVGDEYADLIAEVCRWCSDDPLERVPESLPVNSVPVRVRLLVALLRLADQLYIDGSRIDLDLLERANLPMKQFARWWAYHYAQTLPILGGQIRFHYFLPSTQKEYLGHIRALIERDFEVDNNPNIQYLWKHGLRLIPNRTPTVRFDQPEGFLRKMGPELVAFLRGEVDPIRILPEDQDGEQQEERCLVLLDYENFILQLGQKGHFLSQQELGHAVITLLTEARNVARGGIEALALGHWDRADLRGAAQMLKDRVYQLVTLADDEDPSLVFDREVTRILSRSNASSQIIFAAPRQGLGPLVGKLTGTRRTVSAWVADLPETEIFSAVATKHRSLESLLSLPKVQQVDTGEFADRQAACVLHLDHAFSPDDLGFSVARVHSLLEQVERIGRHAQWWQLWLVDRRILVNSRDKPDLLCLDSTHPDVVTLRNMRSAVVKALQSPSSRDEGLRQDHLVAALKQSVDHADEIELLRFLELLKNEEVISRDARPGLAHNQPLWHLNPFHGAVINEQADLLLPRFVVALDHVMVREGFAFLHEHTLSRHLSKYMDQGLVDPVYHMALRSDWLRRSVTNQKLRSRDEPIVTVDLVDGNTYVGEAMRNRDIMLNVLRKKWAKKGPQTRAFWDRLKEIKSFTLDRSQFEEWVDLLTVDSVVRVGKDDQSWEDDSITLDVECLVTQRLFGRMYLPFLVRTLRILGATRPERNISIQEVVEKMARFDTQGDRQLAAWTVEYARMIRMLDIDHQVAETGADSGRVSLQNQHGYVRRLDGRELSLCPAIAELTRGLARREPRGEGWIPVHVIINVMAEDHRFGFSREEHEYMVGQAIHRQKLLEERREQKGASREHLVRLLDTRGAR